MTPAPRDIPYYQRKGSVLTRLARHLRFPHILDGHDNFCEALAAFKRLAEPQRQVYRELMKPYEHVITLRFPDGHLLEMKRTINFYDIREPGQGDDQWQGTLLKEPVHILEWLMDAQVVLEATP